MILLNEKQYRTALGLTLDEGCVAAQRSCDKVEAGLEGVEGEDAEAQALNDRYPKIVEKSFQTTGSIDEYQIWFWEALGSEI